MLRRSRSWFPLLLLVAACARAPESEERAAAESRASTADKRADVKADDVLDGFPIIGGEAAPDIYTRHYGVGPTYETAARPRLTLTPDAETASWSLVQAALAAGRLPEAALVRVEAAVAAQRFDYVAPVGDELLALDLEAVPSPTRPGYHLLRVGVRAATSPGRPPPAGVVFAIAVSPRDDRVAEVRRVLRDTIAALAPTVRVTLVSGAGVTGPTADRAELDAAIASLPSGGSLATILARALAGGEDAIALCSDGLSDGALGDPGALVERVGTRRLTVIGFGRDGYDDRLLHALARAGGGPYRHASEPAIATGRALVELLSRPAIVEALELEVQLDPAAVSRYRLLGHESRLVGPGQRAAARVGPALAPDDERTVLMELKLRDADAPLGQVTLRFRAAGDGRASTLARPIAASVVRPALADGGPRSHELRALIERARALDRRSGDRLAATQPAADMNYDRVPVLEDIE